MEFFLGDVCQAPSSSPSWFRSRGPYALEWWMFKAHLQTGIVYPLPCPPLTYVLKSIWGAHLQGVQFVVTNSSSPSHKLAGAPGSSSSPLLSGHPGPLYNRKLMAVKYPKKNQGGTQSPSFCRIAIFLIVWYERRQIRLGDGNMFLVWSCSSRMSFLFPGGVRGPQSKVLAESSLECRLNLKGLGHLHQAWNPHVNSQSQLPLTTYFSWEADKHFLVRSVGFIRSYPSDGAHPKSSSQANSNAQLRCVSSHPTTYYLDMIASDSVAYFHHSLRW